MTDQTTVSTSRLANDAARTIRNEFARFHDTFRGITRLAGQRFEHRDWHGLHADARQRLEVREQVLQQLLRQIRSTLNDRLQSRLTWVGIKAVYSGLITHRDDWEVAETFFNSVTRRVFATVGLDPEIEFVHTDFETPPIPSREKVFRTYEAETTVEWVRKLLADHSELYQSQDVLEEDTASVASYVNSQLASLTAGSGRTAAEFAKAVFYRGENAYLMGRLVHGAGIVPLVLCFTHGPSGPHVDAVLMRPDDVSLLFSFTRSYFQVEIQRPHDVVAFINTLIPRKRVAEIYISLGYNKHGKTELYRNALRHLARSTDKYQLAEGQRGMVMIVFTMPSYPVVFKIIRDRFEYPKDCTRASVVDRYHLIFKHDRAGRLVDAQEYEYLVLDRSRFADSLLEELDREARDTVSVEGSRVVIKHCYAERRIVPLDVYLRRERRDLARRATIDYGQAIKDLALTNLFPGDLLTKNFGVTRSGRVVFYDYDEVCLLTECNFRRIPDSGYYDDELAAEPWFGVGAHDVFPEEFIHFLGMPADLKRVFLQEHGDLLNPDFWNQLKQRIAAGELFHVAPYAEQDRLGCRTGQDRLPRLVALENASGGTALA
ncbi:MAG: bifunctional isocitrate dehydrogenase kinase/phosphatase [Bythopirellula sp.]